MCGFQQGIFFQSGLATCTCSIGALPPADVMKNLGLIEPGTGLGIVDEIVCSAATQGGRGAVRRLSSSMGPNGFSIAEESVVQPAEASFSDGQASKDKENLPTKVCRRDGRYFSYLSTVSVWPS